MLFEREKNEQCEWDAANILPFIWNQSKWKKNETKATDKHKQSRFTKSRNIGKYTLYVKAISVDLNSIFECNKMNCVFVCAYFFLLLKLYIGMIHENYNPNW